MAKRPSSTGFSLKDHLFNRPRVEFLAKQFADSGSDFDDRGFMRDTMNGFESLELKQRIVHIASVIENHLHSDFKIAAGQIVKALQAPLDPSLADGDFGDFIFAPLGEFVVRNGMKKQHVKLSLKTLRELTMRFSMEDAIRYFIDAHPQETLSQLKKWTTDKNYHVRRLVSEGTRPLLPWSGRISLEVGAALPYLDALHADPTRYVTRSVANHLNDIAKVKPRLVTVTLKQWKASGLQSQRELDWMTRHALRTLVKQGHADALKMLGFRTSPAINVTGFKLSNSVTKPGGAIDFSFTVNARREEPVLLDHVIDFVKADGSHSPKVFKIKQAVIKAGESLAVKKRHPFRANASTFTLYPGIHRVTLQINGQPMGSHPFEMQ